MRTRTLGPFTVSALGFGCMPLSYAYGEAMEPAAAARQLNLALDTGYTMLDTAALYGFGANETLLGEAVGHRRDAFVLASKCGLFKGTDGKRAIDGRPDTLKRTCDEALIRLKTEVIDLYYLHRVDAKVPVEDSVGALADLVRAGKVRAIGLSEVSADTLRRAHAVHPIAAVQSEYSLWTRNPEIAVLDACQEVGAAFVAFSPLARGFLTGGLKDVTALAEGDIRRSIPRFSPDAYTANLRLLDGMTPLAEAMGCTLGQLALAWLLDRAEHVIPIPGTRNPDRLRENAAAADLTLSADTRAALDALFTPDAVQGGRYKSLRDIGIDSEEFESKT